MSKIIAPLYQHDILSKQILDQEEMVLDTTLLPLHSFVDEIIDHTDNNYDTHLKEILSNIKDQLLVLSSYTDNELFIRSIKDFHISMHLYKINTEDLKNQSSKDKDLKLIFESLQDLIPNEVEKILRLQEVLEVDPIKDAYITTQDFNDYEKYLVQLLFSYGLKQYEEESIKTENVSVYYANNMRSEVEASAQLIVNNNLKNAQVIVLEDTYLDLVKQVYDRYNIQTNLSNENDKDTYSIKMLSVFNLILKQDKKAVTAFLSANPFNLKHNKEISILHDFFNFDFDALLAYEITTLDDPILNKHDLDYYNELSQRSEEDFILLKKTLVNIYDEDPLKLTENIFNYFQEYDYDSELVSLQNTLLKNKDEIKATSDLSSLIKSLVIPTQSKLIHSDFVVVSRLEQHHYFNKKDVIILGSSIKNYPNLKQLSGVIDETYVKDLSYPKKTKRFNEQLEALEKIKTGENIYIFYPLSTNEGKGIEPSFSLLNFAKDYGVKPERYPLIENEYYAKKVYELDADLAQQLFFKDGVLLGSISAFEQYNKCHYAYYLKYGLKLYPKSLPSLSYAYLGSVTHLIIERIVTNQIEGKGFVSHDEVIAIINDAFSSLDLLNDPQVNVVKLCLIKQLLPVLKHMQESDADTNFKAIALEEEFTLQINKNIHIYGIIDRIDQYDDYLRIIDYKSSIHKLSGGDLKRGLQLQLITYLIAMSEAKNLKPAGAFYSTLRLNNSTQTAAKITKSKPFYTPLENSSKHENFLEANRLEGWHFASENNFYESNKYVKSLRVKDGIPYVSSPYNYDTVTRVIEKVYENIYDDLSRGLIDCKPVENPCGFCEYQSICQSQNSNHYRAQIYKNQKLTKEWEDDVDQ